MKAQRLTKYASLQLERRKMAGFLLSPNRCTGFTAIQVIKMATARHVVRFIFHLPKNTIQIIKKNIYFK